MFGPGLLFQSLSTFVDATPVLNICKSTLKILYNKSTRVPADPPCARECFFCASLPHSSSRSGEKQRQLRAAGGEKLLFCNMKRVFHQGQGVRERCGQRDLPRPRLILWAEAQTEGRAGGLWSPPDPNLKLGGGWLSREPSTHKIEMAGSKNMRSGNAGGMGRQWEEFFRKEASEEALSEHRSIRAAENRSKAAVALGKYQLY